MAAQSGTEDTFVAIAPGKFERLERELRNDIWTFDFFQAVRLLEISVERERKELTRVKSLKLAIEEKKVDDRVMNRLAGKLWIDAQEFEMARIDFHLTEKVSIGWGGILASLQKFAFTLTRTRVAEGVWFNRLFSGDIEGRKMLGALRLKIQDRASDFKEVPAETAPVKTP